MRNRFEYNPEKLAFDQLRKKMQSSHGKATILELISGLGQCEAESYHLDTPEYKENEMRKKIYKEMIEQIDPHYFK